MSDIAEEIFIRLTPSVRVEAHQITGTKITTFDYCVVCGHKEGNCTFFQRMSYDKRDNAPHVFEPDLTQRICKVEVSLRNQNNVWYRPTENTKYRSESEAMVAAGKLLTRAAEIRLKHPLGYGTPPQDS